MNNLDPKSRIVVHVSIKLLLRNGEKILFLESSTQPNKYDLPGGRINVEEWEKSFTEVLMREIIEELGEQVRYTILPGDPAILRFTSKTRTFDDGTPIRAIVLLYEGKYISGDIQISSEHASYKWVDSVSLDTKDCMVGEQFGRDLNYYLYNPL